jgi:hypothetical protein
MTYSITAITHRARLSVAISQSAATQCYVATNPALGAVSGQYFADCNIAKPRADAEDPSLAKRLWDESEKIAMAQ